MLQSLDTYLQIPSLWYPLIFACWDILVLRKSWFATADLYYLALSFANVMNSLLLKVWSTTLSNMAPIDVTLKNLVYLLEFMSIKMFQKFSLKTTIIGVQIQLQNDFVKILYFLLSIFCFKPLITTRKAYKDDNHNKT